ncbi:MAG: glycosyltransferase family 4 protein [Chloroflexi bacterium]|nr:glycosyltransferase family 4 protein [Chloroflexota bacterium]
MRLLVHSYVPISPFFDGAGHRLNHLIPSLTKVFDCDLIQERWKWESNAKPLIVEKGSDQFLINHFKSVLNVYHRSNENPSYSWVYKSNELEILLYKLIKTGNYDAIFSGNDTLPIYLSNDLKIPVIIGGTDSMHLHYKRSLINSHGFLQKKLILYRWISYFFYQWFELRRIKYWVMISKPDINSMKPHLKYCKFEVIPNGVDMDYFSNPENESHQPRSLVFIGTLGENSPNEVALEWFIKKVWGKVNSKLPEVTLSIIGPRCSTRLQSICSVERNILIMGYIPDVRPYYWNSGIFVLPMQSGAGVKNKALEAWASGCAVVSTSLGMEGIAYAKNGNNVLIADEPNEFSNLLISIINDKEKQRKLGIAGREIVKNHFSWDSIGSDLCNFITNVIDEQSK